MSEKPIFFASPDEFRAWLDKNHNKAKVLFVGYYRIATGKASLTWEQSVDEALCYGWIDGRRNRIDEERYTIRFTPRRPGSHWSQKNIASVQKLIKAGRMQPAGMAAWEARDPENRATASYEQGREPAFDGDLLKEFQANNHAWDFFQAQPPGYRRTVTEWVTAAKQESTRLRRLRRVIEVSAEGKRVDLMSPFKRTQ